MSLYIIDFCDESTGGGGGLAQLDVGGVTFIDATFGNDGTGAPNRADLPYLTLLAAWNGSASTNLMYVRNGAYTLPTFFFSSAKPYQFYFEAGCVINSPSNASLFRLTGAQNKLYIYGHADFVMNNNNIVQNIGTNDIPEITVNCRTIVKGAANTDDAATMQVNNTYSKYVVDYMNNIRFTNNLWTQTTIECDNWDNDGSESSMIENSSWNTTTEGTLGPGFITLQGRTTQCCEVSLDSTSGQIPYIVEVGDNADVSESYVEVWTSGEIGRAYGFACHQGKLIHHGTLTTTQASYPCYWQFSGALGGFGTVISNANVTAEAGRVFLCSTRGDYIFNGFYKGAAAEVFHIGHDYNTATTCRFTFKGVALGTNLSGRVFTIRKDDIGSPLSTSEVIFNDCYLYNANANPLLIGQGNYIINYDNNYDVSNYKVLGKLTINGVINPSMQNLSQGLVMADSSIQPNQGAFT